MKYIKRLLICFLLLVPFGVHASLESQVRADLEGMLRMAFGNVELDTVMLKRTLDEGVAEIKSQEPWLLIEPDPNYPITPELFQSTFERFMMLSPKDRRRDILTYYGMIKEKSGLNPEQMILFHRLMQYQLAIKNQK